ncbi:MAG: hypothetical protein QOJ96_955 [Alphaproteobacteria bacterium]|jgi:hypothetical protein|nr:hypothetical protein [Alphaproteobacteria bacterium]
MLKTTTRYAVTAALAGALAISAATPSFARNGRIAAAVGGGLVAGAVIGAAAANANNYNYYEPGPAYGPYAYSSGYVAGPYAGDAYAYEPEPVYQAPARAYAGRCWVPVHFDQDDGMPGADTLGHWGSCAEPNARLAR